MNPLKEMFKFHKLQMEQINKSLAEDQQVEELEQEELSEEDKEEMNDAETEYNENDAVDLQIDQWKEEKHEKEINDLLNYACKEGNIDPVDVESWTINQKEDYYDKCMAYEPENN